MQKQLKPKSSPGSPLDYSYLLLQQPEDSSNILKQEVMKSAFKKAKGQSLTVSNQRESFVDREADKILQMAEDYPEENLGYQELCDDLMKAKQYSQVKMAMFQMQVSGSSSDQMQPMYQPAYEVVQIATGSPKTHQLYIITKTSSPDPKRIEPRINMIQHYKPQNAPEIELSNIKKSYKIYKITVSSAVRKYEIVAESNKIQLKSKEIRFEDKEDYQVLLFDKAFFFDFGIGRVGAIGLLEQVLVFSVVQATQMEVLKTRIQGIKPNDVEISDELFEIMQQAESIQYFCELILLLTQTWQIQKLTPQQTKIYRLLARAYLSQKSLPFLQQSDKNSRYHLIYVLTDIILQSESVPVSQQPILTKSQSTKLLQKILSDIANRYQDNSAFIVLEKIASCGCRLLKDRFGLRQFLEKFLLPFCGGVEDRVAAQIMATCYYFRCQQDVSPLDAMLTLIEGITPEKQELSFKTSKYLNLAIPSLFQILQKPNRIKPSQLKPQQFRSLIQLYPFLQKLQKNSPTKMSPQIAEQIREWGTKKLKLYLKEKKQNTIIQVLSQMLFNQSISVGLFKGGVDSYLVKILEEILLLKIQDQPTLKKINKLLIVEGIRGRKQFEAICDKYARFLTTFPQLSAFRILNQGLNQQFFSKQQNEVQFQKILSQVITHFYRDIRSLSANWSMGFIFYSYINERILSAAIKLKKAKLNEFEFSEFLHEMRGIVRSLNISQEEIERLEIIIEQEKKLEKEDVRKYLSSKEKFYLKVLLDIVTRSKDERSEKVKQFLNETKSEIMREQYSYFQLTQIFPYLEKDQQRLSKLLGPEAFKSLKNQIEFVSEKIKRLHRIQQFLDLMKQQISVPSGQVEDQKNKIRSSTNQLRQAQVLKVKNISTLPAYEQNILALCRYSFLFKKMSNSYNSLPDALRQFQESFKGVKRSMENLLRGLNKGELLLDEYKFFFGHEELSQEEMKQMLKYIAQENIPESVAKISLIVEYNKKIQFFIEISQALGQFLEGDPDMNENLERNSELIAFHTRLHDERQGQKITIKQYETKFKTMQQILKRLQIRLQKAQLAQICNNLPLENLLKQIDEYKQLKTGPASWILSLIILTKKTAEFEKLKTFEASMASIKEMFNNSNHPNLSLRHQDFQNYNSVMKFYNKSYSGNKSLKKIIQAIKENSEKININVEESFNRKLISLANNANQFQQCYLMLKNPNHLQRVSIQKLVTNSRIIISLNSKDHSHKLTIEVKLNKDTYQEQKLSQLQKYKDEAYIIKNKSEDYSEQDQKEHEKIKKKVQTFLKMYGFIHEIDSMLGNLLRSGFMLFQNNQDKRNIVNEDLGEVFNYLDKISTIYKKWDQEMKVICSYSSKATMLGGPKIKQFYELLIGKRPEKDFSKYRYITDVNTFKLFMKKKVELNEDLNSPFKQLQIIKQFFKFLKTNVQKTTQPAKDREQHYVELFRFEQEQKDYICCLNEISKQKLKNISEGQIISCKSDTTKQDIQSFIERTILDPDNQYILLGYDNLDQKLQNLAIAKIEESMLHSNSRIKLCVTGRETSHAIYRFLNNKMRVTNRKEGGGMKEETQEYLDFFLQKINNQKAFGLMRLYKSTYPGLGKTHQITKQIAKIKHKVIYFPISGKTTSQKLFSRLQSKLLNMGDYSYSLLLQIYEIEESSKDIVNDFIRQLMLMRSFQYCKEICTMDLKTRIYVEIQDQTVLTLPILNYLNNNFKEIVVEIDKFQFDKIQYTAANYKLSYILDHLEAYDKNLLDTTDLIHPHEYKSNIKPNLSLLKKYFIDNFPKNLVLNFYQFKYWVNLFYELCGSFTGNYVISHKFFVENYPGKSLKEYQIEKIRSEFFKVLLENSIEFLTFSVQNLLSPDVSGIKGPNKNKAQNSIQFFIVPNNQFSWFSFIYKQTSNIPKPIRSFMVSQASLENINRGKKYDELEKIVFKQKELKNLSDSNQELFEKIAQQTLRNISGINSYKLENDPGYVLNMDNFIKICLISYKMQVNIPLVIQGEAGVGKTALLRHLTQQVFKYDFIPHTINAGLTEQLLLKKIKQAEQRLKYIEAQNNNKHLKKKVCILFDQFNTLPELGYIKQLMMENRFMGEQMDFFKDLIVFAACNPYRALKKPQKQKSMLMRQQNQPKQEQQPQHLAFTVKRPPLSMGEIMWNFGSLSGKDMDRYVSRMINVVDKDLAEYRLANLVCQIQNKLNGFEFGSASLRDVQRFRQLYLWLRDKLPVITKTKMDQEISNLYQKKSLRAFAVALNLTYFSRLNTKAKYNTIAKLVDEKSANLKFKTIKKIVRFEQEDFSQRIKINYEGVYMNAALRENLYCVFVCFMTRLPILIVGSPGCSKSLASRIISDNLKQSNQDGRNMDAWLSQLPKISQFFFQGSQNCTTSSVQKKFEQINRAQEIYRKRNEKSRQSNKVIPVFVFDQMGLAEKSPDNPLKAIHEPLELSVNTNKKVLGNQKTTREIAFLGISNNDLDLSKMSRFLVLRRADLDVADLEATAKGISKSIFAHTNFNHTNLQPYLQVLSLTYCEFINEWKSQAGNVSQIHKNFFGLRDFYNMIRTTADLIKAKDNRNNNQNFLQICDLAIYRNFNGLANSYNLFRNKFFKKLGREPPKIQHKVLHEVMQSLGNKSRRYPLLIVPDSISQSVFLTTVSKTFQNSSFLFGSPFIPDSTKTDYITTSITKVMKIVESNKILIASSLNKTAQGALFDLFNKFFIKRDGNDFYRIALQESGYNKMATVNPNFNAAIVINSEYLFKESAPFLNRFQKYQFNLDFVDDQRLTTLYNKLNTCLASIEDICQQNQLSHYKRNHLFLNLTPQTLKSLIMKQLIKSQLDGPQSSQIYKKCIYSLSKVATKDFQYILNLILPKSETQLHEAQLFKQGLEKKIKAEKEADIAIVIVTSQSIWKTNKNDDKILKLDQYKGEKNFVQDVLEFYKGKRDGTLYIDFSKEAEVYGANMNDSRTYFKQNQGQSRIELNYILNILKTCKQQCPLNPLKKTRIILNYNRIQFQRFTPISFLEMCDIYSLDGSGGSESKRAFKDVNLKDVLVEAMKGFSFDFDADGLGDGDGNLVKKVLEKGKNQICRNSLFVECCKDAVAEVLGNQTQINEQDKIKALKNPDNVKNFSSIVTALTNEFSKSKLLVPTKIFIKLLLNQSIILAFSPMCKNALLSRYQTHERALQPMQGESAEEIKPFLKEMMKQKIQYMKKNYRELKQKLGNQEQKVIEVKLTKPTYFPYSQIETKIMFSPEIEQKIKTFSSGNFSQFSLFEEEYNKKLQEALKPNPYSYYKMLTRSTNQQWKKMLMVDVLIVVAEKAKISSQYVFHFANQIQSLIRDSFLVKIVMILSNLDFWCSVLKIFHALAENEIYKKMKPFSQKDLRTMGFDLLRYCQSQLGLSTSSVQSLKVQGSLNDKLKRFTQIHHNIFFEIENLVNSQILETNHEGYKQMVVTQEFLSLWETIQARAPQLDLTNLLKSLSKQKYLFPKIQIIKDFLLTAIQTNQPLSKEIYEYLANKLFPKWLNECGRQQQTKIVFGKFYELCEKSLTFAHHSTGAIYFALKGLKIDFSKMNVAQIVQAIRSQEYTALRPQLLMSMATVCQEHRFDDNLSVLFCNILEINIKRFNLLTMDPAQGFTFTDLQLNFDSFKLLIQQMLNGRNPVLKLFAFAFFKQYLYHYVTIAKPQNKICVSIDEILCQNNALMENLRFYCLKILRKRLNSKEISEQFVKIGTYKWCSLFKTEMKEEQSRAIEVPKIMEAMEKPDIEAKIELFRKFEGRDVQYLDEIVNLGSGSLEGRYIIFNFFMKYIYTMAYNKQYKQAIIGHVKSKQAQYTKALGKAQYSLLLRYTTSTFDSLYSVQTHQTFSQHQFIILNNINWLLASKKSSSPMHSLFFKQDGSIHESIQKEISQSFVPGGVENHFLFFAGLAYTDTKNCNVGVYLCGGPCDFIYTHLNCGWPNQSKPCDMCGRTIGSGGGHRLARANQGARRLMSQKFIDNGNFYIYNFKGKMGEQFWEAQRCYIQAQINRIRTKKQMVYSPEINRARQQQTINLLGYDINKENDKFGTNRGLSMAATSVLMLCFEANLYAMVSLDLIRPDEYQRLFKVADKGTVLGMLNQNMKRYVDSLRQVVDLNTKFYTWMFGIQAQIYKFLINFPQNFHSHVQTLQSQSTQITKKLKQKEPTLNNDQYRALYNDLIRVIESGITLKQYRDIEARKEMSARNQFTRLLFEQEVEKIVSGNLLENKMGFVEIWYQAQGKMQFPFDIVITENKYDPKKYVYSRMLKVPSDFLTIQQICNKYEIIIRDKHPFLNYLLKNTSEFSQLQSFFQIIKVCNKIFQKADYQMTRGYAKKYPLFKFNQDKCRGQINLPIFFRHWKRIANYLGPVQIGCKMYGNANSQLKDDDAVYNFVLDNIIKQNANGKIIAGIYHNFAKKHNETLSLLSTNKNLIQKYRNMNLFGQNYKINPQKMQESDCLTITAKQLTDKIIQSSVSSVKYGDNLVYHNFDQCQAYFLVRFKGRCQLVLDQEKYQRCRFVGETFNQVMVGTNVNAYGDIRQIFYNPLSQPTLQKIHNNLSPKPQLDLYKTFGLLEQLVNKMSQNTQALGVCGHMQIKEYIKNRVQNLNLDDLLTEEMLDQVKVDQVVPLMEAVEAVIRPMLKDTIPKKYWVDMKSDDIVVIKELLVTMQKDDTGMYPTVPQFRTAIQNYVYRNLLSQINSQQKRIFQFILAKQDLWPYGYDIYTKNYNLTSDVTLNSIQAQYAVRLMELVEGFDTV